MPYGLSQIIDEQLRKIETPNVNPGWVAMSPSGQNIVWCIANQIRLPKNMIVVSNDYGKTFKVSTIHSSSQFLKVYSNRVNSSIFYGFDELGKIYLSKDSGITFQIVKSEMQINLPSIDFSFIDTANKTEIRVVGGQDGILYIALGEAGLWKVMINHDTMTYQTKKNNT